MTSVNTDSGITPLRPVSSVTYSPPSMQVIKDQCNDLSSAVSFHKKVKNCALLLILGGIATLPFSCGYSAMAIGLGILLYAGASRNRGKCLEEISVALAEVKDRIKNLRTGDNEQDLEGIKGKYQKIINDASSILYDKEALIDDGEAEFHAHHGPHLPKKGSEKVSLG